MAEIRMHDGSQIEWLSLRQIVDDKMAATLDDADLDSLMATHEKGDINDPVLQEFKQLAGSKALPHAHDVPEIIYLLEGSMHVTGRELGAGSSACIGQDTVYGFEAGKDGARVLIFMQRGEYAYWNQKSFTKLVKEGAREFAKPVAVSVAADEVEWRRLGDVYPPEYARNLTAADLDVQIGAH